MGTTGQGGTRASCALKKAKACTWAQGLPACSQASLEGDGALSRGTAQRRLLKHHFPYLVFLFETISGKYDMAESAGAHRAHWALGTFCWEPAAGLPLPCTRGAEPAPAQTHLVCKGVTVLGSVANVLEYMGKGRL